MRHLVEQNTNERFFLAYLKFRFRFSSKSLLFPHLYGMQLLSGDATIFEKKMPSKLAYSTASPKCSVLPTGPDQPKSHILSHKNCSPRNLYIMTLDKADCIGFVPLRRALPLFFYKNTMEHHTSQYVNSRDSSFLI